MEEQKISEYSNIYVKILEIGESKLSVGLSYHELINELKTCIEYNGCSVIAIKKFFCDNFFHKELHDGKSTITIAEFDTHHNCNFVMSGEAWNKLQQYKHFQNSKTQINLLQGQISLAQQSSNESKQESNLAKKLAYGSIIISLLCGIPDLVSLTKDNDIDHLPKEIEETINQLPSTTTKTNQLLEQLVDENRKDSMYLKTMNESLKTLNNYLKRDKNK